MGSKIIYANVSLKNFDLDAATRIKSEALPTVISLLNRMHLRDSYQRPVKVDVQLDELAFDKGIYKQARASRLRDATYRIEIGVGLIAQLSVIARAIAADKSVLRGRSKSKLLTPEARKDGREKALGDFVFHFMLTFVMWHEVSHIALGHLDWLEANAKMNAIEEFGQVDSLGSEFIHYQALEGDADRQASLWSVATIVHALSANPFLKYPVFADALYDIGYIYGALFMFLDSVDNDIPSHLRKHPIADVRLGIVSATFFL